MTKIATIVQNSAEIVNIVSLKVGDVYKRVNDSDYNEPTVTMGIVTGILNDGITTAVTAIEVRPSYQEVLVEYKVMTAKRPVAIFPATPLEIKNYFSQCEATVAAAIEKAEKDLLTKRNNLNVVRTALSVWELTEPQSVIVPKNIAEVTE